MSIMISISTCYGFQSHDNTSSMVLLFAIKIKAMIAILNPGCRVTWDFKGEAAIFL